MDDGLPGYATLAELRDAYARGELPEAFPVVIGDDEAEVITDWCDSRNGRVFRMQPGDLLEQALELLGIPFTYP